MEAVRHETRKDVLPVPAAGKIDGIVPGAEHVHIPAKAFRQRREQGRGRLGGKARRQAFHGVPHGTAGNPRRAPSGAARTAFLVRATFRHGASGTCLRPLPGSGVPGL